MSAARVSAATTVRQAGRLRLTVDETGRITSVAERRHLERPFLAEVDLAPAIVAGGVESWLDREVGIDDDEIDITVRRENSLSVNLRHSLSTGWASRLLIVNTGAEPLVVERLPLRVRPAPGHRVSALAAGSRICWTAQAEDGHGPLLTVRLTAGAAASIGAEHIEFGGLRLTPGQRYVAQLRWELLATPRSVVVGPGRDVLVARAVYEVGESALLPDDPDAALVVPPDVAVDSIEEADLAGREVFVTSPGRHEIELRSAEGDVRWELSWVRPLADQLQAWADTMLARPRTSAGVVAIEDLPSAIVLQAALGAGGLEDADDASDALDLLTARLLDGPAPGGGANPQSVLYLLGEHGRTGDLDVVDAAVRQAEILLAQGAPPMPGLGLAVLRMVLATASGELGSSTAGRVSSVVAQCVARAAQHTGDGDDRGRDDRGGEEQDPGISAVRRAAELELLLAVLPLLPPDPGHHQRISELVRVLGAALGGGLPGRLLRPPPVTEHAYLVAVLRMLPEDGYPEVTRSWGAPAALLAQQATLQVLDRLTLGTEVGTDPVAHLDPSSEIAAAAAWLALVQRHG